jgi:hypothetical protein
MLFKLVSALVLGNFVCCLFNSFDGSKALVPCPFALSAFLLIRCQPDKDKVRSLLIERSVARTAPVYSFVARAEYYRDARGVGQRSEPNLFCWSDKTEGWG